jgi:hypothetical protein
MTPQEKLDQYLETKPTSTTESETIAIFLDEYNYNFLPQYLNKKYLEGVSKEPDEVEKRFVDYHRNLSNGITNPTKIRYMCYPWENQSYFVIPGYMSAEDEILEALPKIIAENLRKTLFNGDDFVYRYKCFPIIRWKQINGGGVEWLFDCKWTDEQWSSIMQELKKLSQSKSYKRFLEGLNEIRSQFSDVKDENFFIDREKWEGKYELRFPLNLYDLEKVSETLITERLEILEDKIYRLREVSHDQNLALREFLEVEYKPLIINGLIDKEKYIKGLLKEKIPRNQAGLVVGYEFESYVNTVVAARLRDKYDHLVNNEVGTFKAPQCSKEHLLIAALVLSKLGLIRQENQAISFLTQRFQVQSGQGSKGKVDFLKAATITKLRTILIAKATPPKVWRELRIKINDFFSA